MDLCSSPQKISQKSWYDIQDIEYAIKKWDGLSSDRFTGVKYTKKPEDD
jgi:hypothetical protein